MRRASALAATLAAVCWVTSLSAQGHPSFAGKWTIDTAKSEMGAAGGGGMGMGGRGGRMGGGGMMGWGQEFTITQDASTLKVERNFGGNPISETYKLDGSESSNAVPMGRGGSSQETSTAKWDGNTLVVDSKQSMDMGGNAMTMTTTRKLSLDASGNLVVETARSGMRGNQMTTTMVYTKGS